MSKAPETIWACESASGQCVVSFSTPSEDYRIEYRRADLLASTIGAKLMQERAAALMETASENCRDNFTYPPKTKEQRDYQTGAIIHSNAAAAIRALPAPTEAEVLAAALGMFEVSNLIEAAVALHADMIVHADTSIGEDGIERGAIVWASQDVWQMFQSALALVRP